MSLWVPPSSIPAKSDGDTLTAKDLKDVIASLQDLLNGRLGNVNINTALDLGERIAAFKVLFPGGAVYADDYASGSLTAGINEALAALGGFGGEVVLGPKEYLISDTVDLPSKTTLRGAGMGKTTIKVASNSGATIIPMQTSPTTGTSYITLKDFTFDGNQVGQTGTLLDGTVAWNMNNCSHLLIQNVEVKNTVSDGIYIQAGTSAIEDIRIENCWIHDTIMKSTTTGHGAVSIVGGSGHAITEYWVKDCLVTNTAYGNVAPALSCGAIYMYGASLDDGHVTGNKVKNSQVGGIVAYTAGKVTIDYNRVYNSGLSNRTDGGNHIFVEAGANRVDVSHNFLDGVPVASDNAIEINADGEVVCQGNTIRNILNPNKSGIGISAALVTIGGNVITGCPGLGITLYSIGTDDWPGSTIGQNVISSCGAGINVRTKRAISICGNTIFDIDGNGVIAGFGIQIGESLTPGTLASKDIVISGNTINHCIGGTTYHTSYGIGYIGSIMSAPGTCLNLKGSITGNTITECEDEGIFIMDASGLSVTGNTIDGNLSDGILLGSVITDVLIGPNIIRNHSVGGKYGINVDAAATVTRLQIEPQLFSGNTLNMTANAGIPALVGATPDVSGVTKARMNDNTAITNFTHGYDGQRLELYGIHGTGPTLSLGTYLQLGAATRTIGPADMLVLVRMNGVWVEESYVANS